MSNVRRESIAIVAATHPDVSQHHATIMLRMWHHLLPYPEREALLADYHGAGQSGTLIQTFLAACLKRAHGPWPRFRPPAGFTQSHAPVLERAFARALKDVLGAAAIPMVVNAWCEMLRAFLGTMYKHVGASPPA